MTAARHLVARAAETGPPGFAWWVLVPTLVLLAITVAAAPIWPWSRRWGWPVFGIFAVSAATAAIFTVGWWFS